MASAHDPSRAARLVSQLLLEDGDLRDIVEEFVEGLGDRIRELQQAHDRLDWDSLATVAHRLKGAAGSYGYPDISHLCAEMERKFRAHEADEFAAWIAELSRLTAAARRGLSAVEWPGLLTPASTTQAGADAIRALNPTPRAVIEAGESSGGAS